MTLSLPPSPHRFSEVECEAVYRAIAERRDMRHFLPDPVDPEVLQRLLWAAHQAPSVGYMQPWRFLRITDRALRQAIHCLVEEERQATARALGERGEEFLRLKVEGILEAAELFVVALAPGRERHVFGRRTLPEMDVASLACAIQNLWLAARAEGLGMGWVSILRDADLRAILNIPDHVVPVAYLCLGHVRELYDQPELQARGWAERHPLEQMIFHESWAQD